MLLKGKAHRQLVRLQGFVEFSKGGRVSAVPSVFQAIPLAMRGLRLGPDETGRDTWGESAPSRFGNYGRGSASGLGLAPAEGVAGQARQQ